MGPTAHLPSRDELLRCAVWIAVVAAAFVLSRPYEGIKHDGILYLAQALFRLYPDIFGGDVFFRWGSQDQYTLFTPVYAVLIARIGLNEANIALVVLSQILFLVCSYSLVRVLVEPGLRGFAMLLLVCGTGIYGAGLTFRIAEPFVTPRPIAEAITLLAVALLMHGYRMRALLLLIAGAALHPLVALAGMLYWWLHHVILDRRWAWMLLAGIAPVSAGIAGIAPFAQLFQQFDQEWLGILFENNYNLFITRWTLQDWTFVACDLVILGIALRLTAGRLRNALKAAVATALVGLGTAFAGADLLQNVLLSNIQAWRVLWLVHWMAVAALPIVISRLWREGSPGRMVAGLIAFCFITRGLPASLAASTVAAGLFWYRDRFATGDRVVQGGLAALSAAAYLAWFNNTSREHDSAFFDAINPIEDFIVRSISKPFVLLVVGIAIAMFTIKRRNRVLAAIAASGFLAFACFAWDQRTPYRAYIESVPIGSHPFSRLVAPIEEVYWRNDLVAPWFMMLRRSYFSVWQQSGQMFNRATAMDMERRGRALAMLDLQETVCAAMNSLNRSYDTCEPDLLVLQEICRDAPGLGYVVLTSGIEGKWTAFWTPPVATGGRTPHFYLYDCKTLSRD